MRFVFPTRPVWLVFALVLAVAGCGSGEKSPADASGKDPAAAPPAEANPAVPAGESPAAADAAPAAVRPQVAIDTSLGKIVVELDREKAPITVDNFLSYVEAGEYDQTVFHQVCKDYVVVAGTYAPDLQVRPPHVEIFNEAADTGLKNSRGTIAMSRLPEAAHSATRQFFFNLADNEILDHHRREADEEYGYCVFGSVVEGMDVVDRISSVEVRDTAEMQRVPVETVLIHTARRIR